MKKFFHIFILSSLLLSGCYDDLRDYEQNRLAELKDVKISSLEQQVRDIASSVNTLSQLSSEIGTYIDNLQKINNELKDNLASLNAGFEKTKSDLQSSTDASRASTLAQFENVQNALETKIADINAVISALQTRKASIDAGLTGLRSHADNDFATKDWVEGTLVTFGSQKALQDDVAGIKAYVDKLSESLIAVENEIDGILDGKLAEVSASLDEALKTEVYKLAESYRAAVADLRNSVSSAFSEALAAAIDESKEKLKDWVSEQLADYWTVAEAKAALEAFNTLVGNVPEGKDIQSQIEDLLTVIEGVEAELTEAYTEAITAAIVESGSAMDQAIIDRIEEVTTTVAGLSSRIETIDEEVTKLWAKVNELDSAVNSLADQIDAISTSIAVLSELEMTLEEYIESVRKTLSDTDTENSDTVNALIEALAAEVESLQEQLDSLKEYVGTKPDDADSIVEWVETSKANVEKQIALYSLTGRIDDIKDEIEEAIGMADGTISSLSTAIDSKIQDSKTTIDKWIDAKLLDYHTVADIDAAFIALRETLKALIDPKDSEIGTLIENLGSRLSDAVEQFGIDYGAAIAEAIEENASTVTAAISSKVTESANKVKALNGDLEVIDADVANIKKDLLTIKADVEQMGSDISDIQSFINDSGYDSLQAIVDYLTGELAKCPTSFATIAQLNALKDILYGNGTTTFGLKGDVAQLASLTARLEAAETAATGLDTFISGYGSTDTIAAILAGINADIADLQKDVDGDPATGKESLQSLIDSMLTALYGPTKSQETASADSIYGRILALSKAVIYRNFNSLEFIPTSEDSSVTMSRISGSWTVQMDFIICPANLVSLLNPDNCKLYIIGAATREVSGQEALDVTISSIDPETGEFTVKGTSSTKPSFSRGFAVLYVDAEDGDEKLSFTSKYISLKVE